MEASGTAALVHRCAIVEVSIKIFLVVFATRSRSTVSLVSRVLALVGLVVGLSALAAPSLLAQEAPDSVRYVTGQAAVAVVGQKTFSSNTPGVAADGVASATGLAVAGDRLIVCDGSLPFTAPANNRILIFDNLSQLTMGASASVVIGQPDFGQTDPGLSESSLNRPVGISTDGQRLAVADWGNSRVLIYNHIPTANGAPADVVVGQSDFESADPNTDETGMRGPNGVFLDGQQLFVADTLNHRVLIYNQVPTSNNAPADVVLGQADFNSAEDQPASETSLRDPTAVFSDGVRLIVTDLGHNRVLIYNQIPTTNNAPADVVVGQTDFTTDTTDNGPASLNFPRYALTDGTRLFIADTGNNRILVFNQIPTSNGAAADLVLGQKDFFSVLDPQDIPQRITAGVLALPVALAATQTGVLVADTIHRRVVKFEPGVLLFDQGTVLSAANFGGNGLGRPTGVTVEVQPDGFLGAGDYYIKVTARNSDLLFESIPSEEVLVTVPEDSKLIVTFDEVPGAINYRAYIGGSPGGQVVYFEPEPETPEDGLPLGPRVEITSLAPDISRINFGGPRLDVTPGSIAVMFGPDLAPQTAVAKQVPLPRELAGTRVLVNSVPAPLFFVSQTKINFQVPWETVGTNASVVVRKRSESGEVILSNAMPVGINELTPGVFTVSENGLGHLLAFHPDFAPVDDEHPIVPGGRIIFYGTGVQRVGLPGDALATAILDTRERGELRVSTGGEVTWSISFSTNAEVFVAMDGGEEVLFAAGAAGTQTAGFVTSGHIYRFILRPFDDSVVGDIVAIAVLDTRGQATDGRSGQIEVTPEGQVTWSAAGVPDARVLVSVDGAPPEPFATGLSGTKQADFITPGHHYHFTLWMFVEGLQGDLLASASLDTFVTVSNGASGNISVDSEGKVTWSTTDVTAARVHLSIDGEQESEFEDGTEGEKTGLYQAGRLYRFVLRTISDLPVVVTGEASPENAVISTTVSVSIQGRDAPIQFAGLAPGFVGVLQFNVQVAGDLLQDGEDAEVKVFIGSIPANLAFLPVLEGSAGEITVTPEGLVSWSTTDTLNAQVYVSLDGGEEVLFTQGISGEAQAPFIQPGHVYRFILRNFTRDVVGKVLDVATLDTRT